MSLLWKVAVSYYHHTDRANRESIEQHGLDPARSLDEVPQTWFHSDPSKATPDARTDVWEYQGHPSHDIEHGSVWSAEHHPDDPVWATSDHIGPEHLRRKTSTSYCCAAGTTDSHYHHCPIGDCHNQGDLRTVEEHYENVHQGTRAVTRGEDSVDDDYDRILNNTFAKHAKTAALDTRDMEGEEGNSQHITRTEYGHIPTSAIADLPGVKGEMPGEHRNKQGEKWESFKKDVGTNGVQRPIFITVDHGDSTPRISEGNHRRDAAVETGQSHVPVQINYFGHAERQHGGWHGA